MPLPPGRRGERQMAIVGSWSIQDSVQHDGQDLFVDYAGDAVTADDIELVEK